MKNLKPFDLEKLISHNPVCTRDGRKAKLVYVSEINKNNPNGNFLLFTIENDNFSDKHELSIWTNGKGRACNLDDNSDIFMLPNKKKLWVGVSKKPAEASYYIHETTYAFDSKEALELDCDNDYFHFVEIEIEI